MNTKDFPIDDAYPIVTPINTYIKGFDLLSERCSYTEAYRGEDRGSEKFQEFLFWRKNMVVWACCTIESFVNLEGVSWMGEEFYKNSIERQRIVEKIRLVFAIKYSQLLERSDETLKQVQQLFDLRNQFVHPKTRQYDESSEYTGQDMDFLINLVPEKIKELVISVNAIIKDPDDRQ